jgi:hypothetical protein
MGDREQWLLPLCIAVAKAPLLGAFHQQVACIEKRF